MKNAILRGLLAAFIACCAPEGHAQDACATLDPQQVLIALRKGTEQPPQAVPVVKFIPSGAPFDVVVERPYDKAITYRAIVEADRSPHPNKDLNQLLIGPKIYARKIPEKHQLVSDGIVDKDSTLLTLQIPSGLNRSWSAGLWRSVPIYIFGCKDNKEEFLAGIRARMSDALHSAIFVIIGVIVFYTLGATAAYWADNSAINTALAAMGAPPFTPKWRTYLNPVVMSAGSNGKGNLTKLQILFFSLVVFALVAYVGLRTGVLTDISTTVLTLIGITGVGTTLSAGTDVVRNRLEFRYWAWFIRKGWLPPGGLAVVNAARWHHIVTSDGEFDVYRFQSVMFSVVVGIGLLATGLSGLGSFTIPQAILGILGLSQAVYILGKWVSPPSCADLNTQMTKLLDAEQAFAKAAAENPDPAAPLPAPALPYAPATLDAAKRRAPKEYTAYMNLARDAEIMFESVTGRQVNDPNKLEPDFR